MGAGDREGGRFTSRLVCSLDAEGDVVAVLSPTVAVSVPVLSSRPFGESTLRHWGALGSIVVEQGVAGLRTARVRTELDELARRRLGRAPTPELHRRCDLQIHAVHPCTLTHSVELEAVDEVPARARRLLEL